MDDGKVGIYRYFKRVIGFVISLIGFIVLIPVFLILIVCIKLDSKGPILFKQRRIGLHKKEFNILKFRTMKIDTPKDTPTHLLENPDMYITKVGKFLRKTSLDELPQIINIIKGDMSLVGPRPEIPRYVDHFKYSIPLYMVRHQVRPGITGWAQVNGLRGDTSIRARVDYDLYYIENWSMLFDIKILLMTPFKGVVNHQESLK